MQETEESLLMSEGSSETIREALNILLRWRHSPYSVSQVRINLGCKYLFYFFFWAPVIIYYYYLFFSVLLKYKDIILIFIFIIINMVRCLFFFDLGLNIIPFDFINEPDNPSSQGGSGSSFPEGSGSSGGGGSGHEQHIYRSESETNEDNDNLSLAKPGTNSFKDYLLAKPSEDAPINTVEDAINHIEALKTREKNLRYMIANDTNISRDIRLRDLDINFKQKPLGNIAKYLDNCRKMDDPRSRIFYKSSPGNTPVENILRYLRNKLTK